MLCHIGKSKENCVIIVIYLGNKITKCGIDVIRMKSYKRLTQHGTYKFDCYNLIIISSCLDGSFNKLQLDKITRYSVINQINSSIYIHSM